MRPQAFLLTIGAELLKGSVLNTNSQFLSKGLSGLGVEVTGHGSCPDEIPAIATSLKQALAQADLVVITGGLGPTPDDVTREALALFFHVPLLFSKNQFRRIQRVYRRYGRRVPQLVRREAFYPENAVPMINRYGIALGFYIPVGVRKLVVVLPGVPLEAERMYDELVVPLVRRHFEPLQPKPALIAKILGHSEPDVMRKLGKSFFSIPFEFGIYPAPGEVTLRLYAESPEIIQKLRNFLRRKFGRSIFTETDISLAEAVGSQLIKRKATLAVAESCTGGLLASEITGVPGSSRYFLGGSICYHNRLKEQLGVASATLRKYGAVSVQTAKALAQGIRRQTGASFGIGITGIAGPGGGTNAKPVGLVYIGLSSAKHTEVGRYLIFGGRRQVQWKASQKALERLWHFLHRNSRGRR